MAKKNKKLNFKKMSPSDWEAHFEDRKKLAAYYEKGGYDSFVEISPQSYIVFVNGRLWEIFKEEELEGQDKWMCKDANDPNIYLDPLPTKKACKEAMASIRKGSEVSEVKNEVKEKKEPKFQSLRLVRDSEVEIAEDDASRDLAEINLWTSGHIILGKHIQEIGEKFVVLKLDYGTVWVKVEDTSTELKPQPVVRNHGYTDKEVQFLKSAADRKLHRHEPISNNQSPFFNDDVFKYHSALVKRMMHLIKVVDYSPLMQTYGLSKEGIVEFKKISGD